MIGICTDSHSLLSPELIARFGIEVVPLTITMGDLEYLDGVDIDIDAYYALTNDPDNPPAAPIQPSSGQFALAYDRLVERGADQILSIHTSCGIAGTLTSARLATRCSAVPVRVIDTATPSFSLSCAVWAAAEAVAAGADLSTTIEVIEKTTAGVGNRFVYEASESCRMAMGHGGEQISLLSLIADEVHVVSTVDSWPEAAQAIADGLTVGDQPLHVVLAYADRCGAELMTNVENLIRDDPNVGKIMRCRIGPSIATFTSNCGAGIFFYTPS